METERLITRLLESHRHVDGDGHSGRRVCEPETLLESRILVALGISGILRVRLRPI